MNIREFRIKYPQYDDLNDFELASKLHVKHYNDMSFGEFSKRFGVEYDPSTREGLRQSIASGYHKGKELREEGGRALKRGAIRLKAAGPGTLAFLSEVGRAQPYGFYKGMSSELDPVQEKAEQRWKEQAFETYEEALAPELAPRRKDVSGYVVNIVGETLPLMAASAAAGAVTGGAGAFVVGFAAEGEAAYQEAIRNGATEEEAQLERMIVGTINGAIERMQADKVLKLGKASIRPIINAAKEQAWKKLGKEAGKLGAQQLAGALSEGLEETLQEITQIGAATIHGDEIELGEDIKRAGGAFLGGAVAGGFLGVGQIGVRETAKAGAEAASEKIDWTDYDEPAIDDSLSHFQPTPRVMPRADTEADQAEARTVLKSDYDASKAKITPEEQEVLEKLERDVPEKPEASAEEEAEPVSADLYMGNITPRAKRVWAEAFTEAREQEELPGDEVAPGEVKAPTEAGFPTKRTTVEMTREQAEETLTQLEEAMDETLMSGESRTPTEIALLKAMWGDIRELRTSLGKPIGRMPFRVRGDTKTPVVEMASPTERVYHAIKGPSKKTLAQWSARDLVTEGEALKTGLRKVAQAASKAYRQGSREAVQKLRRDLRALKAKQRTIQAVRDYRRKLAEKITADPPAGIDPLYKRAVNEMALALDSRKRSPRTQQRLEGLQRAIEQDPDLPNRMKDPKQIRMLERLAKTPVENVSTGQLEDLVRERARLIREGRTQERRMRLKRGAAELKKAALQELAEKKQRKTPQGQGARRRDRWFRKTLRKFKEMPKTKKATFWYGLRQYRLERMMEWLDGFKRGIFTDIGRKLKDLGLTAEERRNVRMNKFFQFCKDNDVDMALVFGKKETVTLESGKEIEFTRDELVGQYCLWKEPSSRARLVVAEEEQQLRDALKEGKITERQFYAQMYGVQDTEGHQMTDEQLQTLKDRHEQETESRDDLGLSSSDVQSIAARVEADPQLKAVGDYILADLAEQWEMIEMVAHEIGMDPNELVHHVQYMPLLVRTKEGKYRDQNDLLNRAIGQWIPEDYGTERGFLKARGKKKGTGGVELSAMLMYFNSVSQVEQFTTMSPFLSQLSHLMADPQFRDGLNNVTYGQGTTILRQWIVDTARGRVVREQHSMAKWLHKLNRRGIIYALAWNVPVMLKQSISVMTGLAKNPKMIPYLARSVIDHAFGGFEQLRADCTAMSKTLATRNMDRHLAQVWNRPSIKRWLYRRFGHAVRGAELSKTALGGIRIIDQWTTTHVWHAAFRAAEADGATQAQAIRYADQVVQRTQPMARPEDLPHFFRGGIVEQWMTLFKNQTNQNLNFWIHDIYGAYKYGKITKTGVAYRVMMSYVLPALMFGSISRGFQPPEDWDDVATDMALYLGGTPILAMRIINQAVNGWGQSLGLWDVGFSSLAKTFADAKEGDFSGVMKNGAAAAGALRYPAVFSAQNIRTVEGIGRLTTGETDDVRRLIWSEWALEQGKKEETGRSRRRRRRKRR